ncbi:MAG: SIR2 family protein [Candidatus Binatia bacterium]
MGDESTAYFLGAGASADAGVPLTNALLRGIANRIRGRGGSLERFIKTFGFLEKDSTGRPPIVDLISLVDSCLKEGVPLNSFFSVRRLRDVRTKLVAELSEVVHRRRRSGTRVRMPKEALDQPGARGLRIAQYFKEFVSMLRPRNRKIGRRLEPGDAIITTNYDTSIDVALYELVYWEESGGDREYSKISDVFLGSNFRDPYEDVHALEDPEAVVDLLKLHGSLNWLYCPKCARAYVSAFGFSVRFLTRNVNDPRIRWELTCWCGYFPLEPMIIAPSVFQDVINPHLRSIWINAYEILENADRWVFVGYSLPLEDVAVRSLLHRAMSGRRHREGEPPRIEVVCPPEDIDNLRPRYVNLFGKSVRFVGKRFSDYVYNR